MSNFYEELCSYSHLIFEDWNVSIERHSSQLKNIIELNWSQHKTILDVSCGIGTQTIGLSQKDYQLIISDISVNEIEQARKEAQQCRQTNISFSVCHMITAFAHHSSNSDTVISCDNLISHLHTDKDFFLALKKIYSCLRPVDGCLITI
ncbi:unnamed protein product [Rotaria sp. Silwood2]|nr:unnamed protein product [Rotaria sp. Silwood2]CAF2861821.1 unnamed protein product [Rotaria sp. Silwood2]CAF3007103.1 unnamed protein product [Rotaria sp. Silwood2]CAF4515785.1 unnamed protein product [Rotaria sp. Silwood2]CAF4702461.1 unnamed protein product [Rotaria sp. Silwood2]